jgi:hypothetical protein
MSVHHPSSIHLFLKNDRIGLRADKEKKKEKIGKAATSVTHPFVFLSRILVLFQYAVFFFLS